MRIVRHLLRLLVALAPAGALAASLTVNPIRLEMAAGARATSLTVTNQSDEPALLQATAYRWAHEQGEDQLVEAHGPEAPLITPPLFRLPAKGTSQVVRIGFAKAPPAGDEQRWRIVVEEVPKSAPPPEDGVPAQALPVVVATRLRISLPLLVAPATVRHALVWALSATPDGLRLEADNRGTVTERLDRIALGDEAQPLAALSGPVYLFPAERRSFVLKPAGPLPAGPLPLHVAGTVQPANVELPLLRAP